MPLKDLVKNDEGVIYLDARVDSIPFNIEKFVTTASLVYTNPSGVQDNATAYVLNIPKNIGSSLSAAALFGGLLSMSLIGWLLLILLVLVIIVVARKVIRR